MKIPAGLFLLVYVLVNVSATDSITVLGHAYAYGESSLTFPSFSAPSAITFEGGGDSSQMGILGMAAFFSAILVAWCV